jgi:sulfite exporter TauE/SafE
MQVNDTQDSDGPDGGVESLLAFCGAVTVSGGGVLALFLAGLIGGPAHCGAMCGGFVLGQVADRMASVPIGGLCEWRRIAGGALLPYHLGRLTTYAGLGALMGAGSGALLPHWMATALLLLGAALFLLRGVAHAPLFWSRAVGGMARQAGGNRFALGVALGFLPCAFLYAALAIAGAGQSAATGALGMLAFGLGTVPTLVAVGVAGQIAGRRWQGRVASWSPALMAVNALLLAGLAFR